MRTLLTIALVLTFLVAPLTAQEGSDCSTAPRLEIGKFAAVADGPLCADLINWWQIEFDDMTGWIAEAAGTYLVDPLACRSRAGQFTATMNL